MTRNIIIIDPLLIKKHTSVVITERRVRSNILRHDIALVLAQILRFDPRIERHARVEHKSS